MLFRHTLTSLPRAYHATHTWRSTPTPYPSLISLESQNSYIKSPILPCHNQSIDFGHFLFDTMLPQLPRLSDYDVSPRNGFLPDEIPLEILADAYYQPWETVVRNFQSLILAKRLRRIVDALPVLDTDLLLTEAEWRRAYSILGFIAHGYVWGGDRPTDVCIFASIRQGEQLTFASDRSSTNIDTFLESMSTP